MNKYIINKNTCLLLKKDNRTLVIEDNRTFYVDKNIKSILNESCKYYGSNYRGRLDSVNEILETKYKNPVLINAKTNLILFPTESIRKNGVMFINYQKIIKYELYFNLVKIILINDIIITTKVSKYILSEQLVKCVLFNNLLIYRNN